MNSPILAKPRSGEMANCERRTGNRLNGFSLIEIVIVMTILALLAAASVPSFRGIMNEQKAREPIIELTRLAKMARLKAMLEKRPYQLAITSQGFTASRYFDPYLKLAELTDFLALSDQAEEAKVPDEDAPPKDAGADPASAGKVNEAAPLVSGQAPQSKPEWNERYTLKPGTAVATQFWHESSMMPLEGETVRLWVFQPNGMCEPIKIQLTHETATLQVEFNALTADVTREMSDVK